MSARLPLADIQFIAAFAAFCRTKGDEGYNYFATGDCAIARFLKGTGRCADPSVGAYRWRDQATGEVHHFPEFTAEAEEPHTFPALADRLEALIADAPMVRS